MMIKAVIDERFEDYRYPSMFIAMPKCSFKCEKESGVRCCQNSALALSPNIEAIDDTLICRYIDNPLTKAIVFGGLEVFDSFEDVYLFTTKLRKRYHCNDDVVIYTGYNEHEVIAQVTALQEYPNIIVKFGRFIPDQPHHHDNVLGVELASPNQYAKRIS